MAEPRCYCGLRATLTFRVKPRRECSLSHRHDALHAYGGVYDAHVCDSPEHQEEVRRAGMLLSWRRIEGAA